MQTCSICGPTANEFPSYGKRCRPCVRKANLDRYYANHETNKQVARERYQKNPTPTIERQQRARAEKKAAVDAAKDKPCTDCGHRFPVVCMDFDHLHSKEECIAILLQRNAPLERILAEIAKCEVVCSNCHRIRTATRRELAKAA
jgi:5-methylcytosine-specific restriction endonuclease McrA